MNIWLPALTSSTVLAIVGYFLSIPYRKGVEAAISSKFDDKVEKLRTDLRKQEELLKADIRKGEQEVNALRSGPLANMVARRLDLDRRRIQALEAIWAFAVDVGKLKWGVQISQTINMDEILKKSQGEGTEAKKVREFVELVRGTANLDSIKGLPSPDKERPFVPPIVWAVFSAYRTVLFYPIVMFEIVKSGAGAKYVSDPTKIMDVLKAALPHRAAFIDEHKATSFSFLADELEERLLDLIREALENPQADSKTIEEAAKIISAVEAARPNTSPATEP